MAGRLLALVLVVAIAVWPSVESQNFLNNVADRCQKNVGKQAAADVLNIWHQLAVCVRFEDMMNKMQRTIITNSMKTAIEDICRQKDELLICFDQAFETIKHCLNEEERQGPTILQGTVKPSMDYFCEHDDELVTIVTSQEEQQCLTTLNDKSEMCDRNESNDSWILLYSPKEQEQRCRIADAFMDCSNDVAGYCKDSTTFRLFNDMFKFFWVSFCSKKIQADGEVTVPAKISTQADGEVTVPAKISTQADGEAGVLSGVGTLPMPLGSLLMVVILLYIFRLL